MSSMSSMSCVPCQPEGRQEPQKRARETHHPATGEKYFESPEHTKPRLGDANTSADARPNASSHPGVASSASIVALGVFTSGGSPSSATRPSAAVAPSRRSVWPAAEDLALREAVATCKGNWKKVAMAVGRCGGKRSEDECLKRWAELKVSMEVSTEAPSPLGSLSGIPVVDDELTGSELDCTSCDEPKGFSATGSTVFSLSDVLITGPVASVAQPPCSHHRDLQVEVDSDDDSDSDSDSDDEYVMPYVSTPDREDLPSLGSAGHFHGLCKRCCFHSKGRCLNGYACNFCHFDHEKRKRKNKNKNKKKKAKARAAEAMAITGGRFFGFPHTDNLTQVFAPSLGCNLLTPSVPSMNFAPPPLMSSFQPLQQVAPMQSLQSMQPLQSMQAMQAIPSPAMTMPVQSVQPAFPQPLNLQQHLQSGKEVESNSGSVAFDSKVVLWVEGLSKKYQFDAADLCQVLGATSTVVHHDGAVVAALASSSAALEAASLDGTLLPDMGGARLRVRVGSCWMASPPVLPCNNSAEAPRLWNSNSASVSNSAVPVSA